MNLTFNLSARLRFLGLCLVVFVAGFGCALARETYAQFAAHLAMQAEADQALRPDLESELRRLTNLFRQSKGLPPLAEDGAALYAARAHAMDMMQHHFMGHSASSGEDFGARMQALNGGAMLTAAMGENAARVSKPGTVDKEMAAQLFAQWVKSAPHRKNLLSSDYIKLAVGVVSLGGQLYADQIFTGPNVKTNFTIVPPKVPETLY